MNVLILGSEGFIGRYLVRHYIGQNCNVTGCDQLVSGNNSYTFHKLSLLNSDLDRLFSTGSFDICIDAAGSGNVGFSLSNPLEDFEANMFAVARVLDNIRKYNPSCIFLQISSAAVYGNPAKLPVQETDSVNPLSPYGWHKLMSEMLCKEYTQVFGLKTVIVRPFSVYGPGLKKQLMWEVHQKYLQGQGTIELWGSGEETRDFIYITDLVAALDIIIKKGRHSADIYNISSGREMSILDISTLLISHFHEPPKVKFNQQTRPGDPLHWRADIGKLMNLGFAPAVVPEEGIRQMATWLNSLT
jgi:UDP-glucose 4-epimerase